MSKSQDPDAQTPGKEFSIPHGARVWFAGHHTKAKHLLAPHLLRALRPPTGMVDVAILAPETLDEAVYFAEKISLRMNAESMLWVVHDGKTDDHRTPNTHARQPLIESLNAIGFDHVTQAHLGAHFEMIQFRRRRDRTIDKPALLPRPSDHL